MTPIAIPYGGYWSTPFARWQRSFAHLHSLKFAAHVAKSAYVGCAEGDSAMAVVVKVRG